MDLCERLEDFGDFKVIRNVISDEEIQSLMNFWNSIPSFVEIDVNRWDTTSTSITKINANNRYVNIVGIQKDYLPFVSNIFTECFSCVISEFDLEFPHYFTHYPLGGKHSKHRDFIRSFNREWVMTLMLNDDFDGGETEFTVLGDVIKPKKGSVLLFSNIVNSELSLFSMHAGLPVRAGSKYICNVWTD